MTHPYLLLWLEAPLQSWGHDSRFGRRDTLDFPTKSGVLGLIACARGAGGEERDWLAKLADLDMQVDAFARRGKSGAPDRETMLRDFHMVGSGYDDQDAWQCLMIPKTSEGKKAVGGGTKMTYRYYLQDMAFAVAIQVPSELLKDTEASLQCPVWPIYLGRKSCAPTELVLQGRFEDAERALAAAEQIGKEKHRSVAFRVRQGEHDGEVVTLSDVPVEFGPRKLYRDRRVTVYRVG